jgi:hypothetical protein
MIFSSRPRTLRHQIEIQTAESQMMFQSLPLLLYHCKLFIYRGLPFPLVLPACLGFLASLLAQVIFTHNDVWGDAHCPNSPEIWCNLNNDKGISRTFQISFLRIKVLTTFFAYMDNQIRNRTRALVLMHY